MKIRNKVKKFVRLSNQVSVYDIILAIIPMIMILGIIFWKFNILNNLSQFVVFFTLNIPVIVYAIFLKPPVKD